MLNPELDIDRIASEFAVKQRLQIPGILAPEPAERLETCLRDEVPWGLAYMQNGAGHTLKAEELRQITPDSWRALLMDVQKTAREGYQFLFNTYQVVTAWKEKRDPHLFVHRFFEFLNSPPMIEFARRVTGYEDIVKADAQATRYLPGHYLRSHNDYEQKTATDTRRAAYVFNLSRDWEADWGGQLQFMDDNGIVTESWLPRYNHLSLFAVPVFHCVSCVAPYACSPRLAITGWFRTH